MCKLGMKLNYYLISSYKITIGTSTHFKPLF